MFMHSIEYNYAPSTFANTWLKNSERNIGHVIQKENEYDLPIPRIDFFKKTPLFSLPAAWNTAGVIKYQCNRTTFKISL
jgi:hypothetical protein